MINEPEKLVTLACRLIQTTPAGAYLFDNGTKRFFLPVRMVSTEPADPRPGDSVMVSVSRALAREKGLDRQDGTDQGVLL